MHKLNPRTRFLLVVYFFVVLLGVAATDSLPLQLLPETSDTSISVEAYWFSASPEDIEARIVEPYEKALAGLPGLREVEAQIRLGSAYLTLNFEAAVNMNLALMEVTNRINGVPNLPRELRPAKVAIGKGIRDSAEKQAVGYYFVRFKKPDIRQIDTLVELVTDNVIPELERIEGVSSIRLNAPGDQREVFVDLDLDRMRLYGVSPMDVHRTLNSLGLEPGGVHETETTRIVIRLGSEINQLGKIASSLVSRSHGDPILIQDIARVRLLPPSQRFIVRMNGEPALAMRVDRSPNKNLLEVIEAVDMAISNVNAALAADNLIVEKSFDPAPYIKRSVSFVAISLLVGLILSILVLVPFYRHKLKALALIIGVLPLSLAFSVLSLLLLERSLNIVSIASIGISSGLTLDIAIIVVAAISRISPEDDAWTTSLQRLKRALYASGITTVSVFSAIWLFPETQKELFQELAIVVITSVVSSVVYSLYLLPDLLRLTEDSATHKTHDPEKLHHPGPASQIAACAGLGVVLPVICIVFLPIQTDVMPEVKRDSLDGFLAMQSGASMHAIENELIEPLMDQLKHRLVTKDSEGDLRNFFVMIFSTTGGSIGIRPVAVDADSIAELKSELESYLGTVSEITPFLRHGNLFGGFEGGRQLTVRVRNNSEEQLIQQVSELTSKLSEVPGVDFVRTSPSIVSKENYLDWIPKENPLQQFGWDRADLKLLPALFGSGIYVKSVFTNGRSHNVYLRASKTTDLDPTQNQVVSPTGVSTSLGQLFVFQPRSSLTELQRLSGVRSVTLTLSIAQDTAVPTIMSTVQEIAGTTLESPTTLWFDEQGKEIELYTNRLWLAFLVGITVLGVTMWVIIGDTRTVAAALLVIPACLTGGYLFFQGVNGFSGVAIDGLTALGFLAAIGILVNNSILLAEETQVQRRQHAQIKHAINAAVEHRWQSVLTSTLTTSITALPLAIVPALGSEIYSGIAAALVGSTLMSIFVYRLVSPTIYALLLKDQKS